MGIMINNNSSTTIYLIRHGNVENPKQVVYGRRDFPLSTDGKAQMERLAKYLLALGITPDVMYTSPMKRARESAEKLQEIFTVSEVVEEENLQEINVQAFEGKPLLWVWDMQRDFYSFAKKNGISIEFPEGIIQRMMSVFSVILKKHAGKTVFVVSHGDPITFLLWKLRHPDEEIPLYNFLTKGNFLRTAQAWEMTFDQEGKIIKKTLVSTQ